MSEQMQTIDVEKIMEEIRENIKKRGYTDEMLSFNDVKAQMPENSGGVTTFNVHELRTQVQDSNLHCSLQYYAMIPKGGLKSFVKRTLRKVLRFLLLPIVDEQNIFNSSAARSLNQLEAYVQEQQEVHDQDIKTIELLEEKIESLTKRCEVLENSMKKGE